MNPPHGLILLRFYGNCSYYTVPVTEDKYRQSLAGVLCSDLILFGYLLVTTAAAAVSEQNVTENTGDVEQAMCVCVRAPIECQPGVATVLLTSAAWPFCHSFVQ